MESSDLEWTNADLFFLVETLRHGMPVDRVAGFLNRSETEVRAKAQELKVSIADDPARKKIGLRSVSEPKLQPAEVRRPGQPAVPSAGWYHGGQPGLSQEERAQTMAMAAAERLRVAA